VRHAWRRAGHRLAAVGLIWGAILASAGPLQPIGASQATPAARPESATCDVIPRAIEDILNLTAVTPDEVLEIGPLPEGEPADPASTAAIAATLDEMAACLTAGQMLRFYALHSDEWLRRFAAQVEGITTFTTSTVPLDDGEHAVYLGPWRVQRLPDGRVTAATLLRVGDELRPDPSRTAVLVFIERDGRWLVDETIRLVRVPGCGTPVEVAAVVGPPPGTTFDFWIPTCNE
jgi:hypothetical protein